MNHILSYMHSLDLKCTLELLGEEMMCCCIAKSNWSSTELSEQMSRWRKQLSCALWMVTEITEEHS